MKFLEQAQQLDQIVKDRYGPNASYNWGRLYYRALKYFTREEILGKSLRDVIEEVGQRERRDKELAAAIARQLQPADQAGDVSDAKTSVLQTKPAGRPPDEVYDEAYQRIKAGKDETDVFRWVCETKGWTNPGKSERDAFKAALRRRRNAT